MEQASSQEQSAQFKKRRRRWTAAEKEKMVNESEVMGVSATARKYSITASQLFTFRKEIYSKDGLCPAEINVVEECERAIHQLNRKMHKHERLADKLVAEFDRGKVPAYNMATGYAALTKSYCDLFELRRVAVEKAIAFSQLCTPEPNETVPKEYELEMEREAEKVLLHLVKSRLIPEQERKKTEEQGTVH